MTRAERRRNRQLAIDKRKRILNETGYKQGSLYTKHVKKIQQSDGYMAKHGTLLHYAQGSIITRKTRDRNSYSGTTNWSYRDQKLIIDHEEQIDEYNKTN